MFKSYKHDIIQGVLRSGGDTKYLFIQSMVSMWLFGVPMALFAAFVLKMPVYVVVIFAASEEVIKLLSGLHRYFSKRWIRNLTRDG
jgi:Na+-driven multidrug efflux pump